MNNINLNRKLCPLCEAEANENNIVDIVENIWENNKTTEKELKEAERPTKETKGKAKQN